VVAKDRSETAKAFKICGISATEAAGKSKKYVQRLVGHNLLPTTSENPTRPRGCGFNKMLVQNNHEQQSVAALSYSEASPRPCNGRNPRLSNKNSYQSSKRGMPDTSIHRCLVGGVVQAYPYVEFVGITSSQVRSAVRGPVFFYWEP
jgi:hypothetical protein